MKCSQCGADNKVGVLICESCSEPMEVPVAATVKKTAIASSAAVSSRRPIMPASVAKLGIQMCCLVESGNVTETGFELPKDDFEFMLGRNDLDAGVIPDIDLTKFAEKVTVEGETGYKVSRKQALLSRRVGQLYLKVIGAARTMHKGVTDWKQLSVNDEVQLNIGDRFRFGGSEGYCIFQLVEK